jgi:hypothetical protein
MKRCELFAEDRYIDETKQGGTAMIHREIEEVSEKVTAMDVYRSVVLGLMGVFYGFLIFLMLL